ncbi:MAG: HIT family protein [Pseudomonadota bacterium]|nr:MAG: HIT family protein [Pseudomonadota bacterium]
MTACPLCAAKSENVLWHGSYCRVILANESDYPGYCRVIWNAHVTEMTDLGIGERKYLMAVVFAVEQVLRELLQPDKINLASLGNQVPHLHWHVIPRFSNDAHFPDPVWAARRREASVVPLSTSALTGRLAVLLATAG